MLKVDFQGFVQVDSVWLDALLSVRAGLSHFQSAGQL
jgi:hypothetical protein